GELTDADGDGVPDICESYSVPGEYATIQAAIDAVPADAFGLVSVAAGTYNESFSLNGKNVVVRGAPKGATILDGTGLTTSIARFAGNEPATAGVENLVFRNGTTGSLITPQTTFLVGGGLFGANSSAFIRNCRFEQNGSDFGAGAYLYRCSMLVEDCVFDANTAVREGGGLQVYETTGTVRNTMFSGNRSGVKGPGSGSGFKSVGALANDESVTLEGCTVTGCVSSVEGSAVEHFENAAARRGVLRLVATSITANTSGLGAGGVRALGNLGCVVLSEGSEVCGNLQGNIDGPYLIDGAATVCDCLADLTGDGLVNGGDLGIVLNSWGVAGPQGYGDVNHDGVIDGVDLSYLLSNWGACP
ncbi:MAG: right-handed parallel beta-helix repeat-containing protein, partial [Phycisphaerales bacterium]